MAKEYYITVSSSVSDRNALIKARRDIEYFAALRGMEELHMRAYDSAHGNLFKWIGLLFGCIRDWIWLMRTVSNDAIVLVQYPHFPIKSALIQYVMLPLITKRKGCRFIGFIHDLDSLRDTNGWGARFSDRHVLPIFTAIICHNHSMKSVLVQMGIPENKLVSLNVFDYETKAAYRDHTFEKSLNIAGNLSAKKSGYLYRILEKGNIPFEIHLYGAQFDVPETLPKAISYHGVIPAEDLPAEMVGAFGLVWDGDSIDTCSGIYGEYMRLNNPHKASLYLASGIPLVVWKESALAHFIIEKGLGIAVSSIADIGSELDAMDAKTYKTMQKRALFESEKLREGWYFNIALNETGRICSEK